LSFIFSTWSVLPQDIREDARFEARQYATTWKGMNFLLNAAPSIADRRAHMEFELLAWSAQRQLFTLEAQIQARKQQ